MCSVRNTRSSHVVRYMLVTVYFSRCDVAVVGPFLQGAVLESGDIQALSMALDDICKQLKLPGGDHPARRIIAERVIELARCGERDPVRLRDRVLKEAGIGRRELSSAD